VCVCEFGNRRRGWHADDDKYDDSDFVMVGSENKLWLLYVMKLGQLGESC
jgi:hypothetical protein